jgi:ribonuclease-3
MTAKEMEDLCASVGYQFRDPGLLLRALTHSSSVVEPDLDNERLEFLGDAVVSLAVSECLYLRFPGWDEGDLTQVKSTVVSTVRLAERARSMGLREHMRLGKGLRNDEELPLSIYANMFEAIVGAIYLDGGLAAAQSFVLTSLSEDIESESACIGETNYKAHLQQKAQKLLGMAPHYRVVSERGPDHGKVFEVQACVGGRSFPPGNGRTKKDAEQAAAAAALEVLGKEAAEGGSRNGRAAGAGTKA